MMEKLKSRKLWATVLTATLLALSAQLGIDSELTEKLVALVSAYVIGQGIADHGKK